MQIDSLEASEFLQPELPKPAAQPFLAPVVENSIAIAPSTTELQQQLAEDITNAVDKMEQRMDAKIEVVKGQMEIDN